MNSMTGFGRAAGEISGRSLTVQVRSVNRKSLDLGITLPRDWEALESELGSQVREVALRGKVHVDIDLDDRGGEAGISWDEDAVAGTLERLSAFARKRRIEFKPAPELLWQIASSLRQPEGAPPAEKARPVLRRLLKEALRAFAAMRAREGEALFVDFLSRIEGVENHIEAMAKRAPEVPGAYRELLTRRLREAQLDFDLGDERVLREIALFADRCDISEELTRLRSHVEQLRELVKAEGSIGRKADFLIQEMSREVHTLGSKANDLTISRHVIELRNDLEQIREQMANVE